ncbi:putative lrr receptor-like serinethreonine-protein kinase [Nicotiana attenuata]|uniref:Lrr receptor-like serinethreonine-protein kinase n=1 Tax=Nicotiana attenuata TaxID=49451 RepID=A0A314KR70_NICAT|nr:putative lrr receptor-like serinethreonine-protein kinase [Nicotiana attenuata]
MLYKCYFLLPFIISERLLYCVDIDLAFMEIAFSTNIQSSALLLYVVALHVPLAMHQQSIISTSMLKDRDIRLLLPSPLGFRSGNRSYGWFLFIVALVTGIQKCKSKSSIIPWKKSGSGKDNMTIYVDTGMLKDVVRYSRQELEVACEDFSNIIGSSSDSLVYKGKMKGGPEIAVILLCIKEEHWTAYLELYFLEEVAELARINHENAGKLLGY